MVFQMISFLVASIILFNSAESAGGFMGVAADIQDMIEEANTQYAVYIVNNCSSSIFLKCASADDAIEGSGSDDDDWWTLENGDALAWGFKENFERTTCFWCYANNNGQEARDSGNWYIQQDVWGWTDCDGPGDHSGVDDDGVTSWEFRDDGAYSNMCVDCDGGNSFDQYATWGPDPNA